MLVSYETKIMENGSIDFILYGVDTFNQYKNFVDWAIKKFKGKLIKQNVLPDAFLKFVRFENDTLLFFWDDWEITSIVANNQEQAELVKKIIEDAKLLKFDEK